MGHPVKIPDRGWRNTPVTREIDSRRTLGDWRVLLALLAAALPFLVYLANQIDTMKVRYRVEELRTQQRKLQEAERRLRIERATVASMARVAERAERDLRLTRPGGTQTLVLRQAPPGQGGLAARAPDASSAAR